MVPNGYQQMGIMVTKLGKELGLGYNKLHELARVPSAQPPHCTLIHQGLFNGSKSTTRALGLGEISR